MENNTDNTTTPDTPEAEPVYELSPEQATSFTDAPSAGTFNRKRVLITICIAAAVVIGGGLALNINTARKQQTADSETANAPARPPMDFLQSQRDRAERNNRTPPADGEPELPPEDPRALPEVTFTRTAAPAPQQQPPVPRPAAPPPQAPGPASAGQDPTLTARYSALVPRIEGSLFPAAVPPPQNQNGQQGGYTYSAQAQSAYNDYLQSAAAAQTAAANTAAPAGAYNPYAQPDPYARQNAQDNKHNFYNAAAGGGSLRNSRFIGANALWIGTMIPGILETGINTDLPGNVLARVTENIYDSQTGRQLLIPQGTVLVARYNSSVSYAQHRVQIVWDTLIRPDGFQAELEGMNSVDRAGMSGQSTAYHENWFEYVKAAGIITMFSIANSKMTETAAQYASGNTASGIAEANGAVVNQLGDTMLSRAMNIQPTLTVDNGTLINIMLNKTVYLPPMDDYPVTQKYIKR